MRFRQSSAGCILPKMRFASGRALRRSRLESRASNTSGAARTQAGEAVRAQSRHATRLRSVRHHHLRVRAARRHVDAQLKSAELAKPTRSNKRDLSPDKLSSVHISNVLWFVTM